MKNKNDKYIDSLFKEKLDASESQTHDWEENWLLLEARLKREDNYKRAIFWLKTIGGIAALLLLAFSLWYIRSVEPIQPVERVVTKTKPQPVESSTTPPPLLATVANKNTPLRESKRDLVKPNKPTVQIENIAEATLTKAVVNTRAPLLLFDSTKKTHIQQLSTTVKTANQERRYDRPRTSLSIIYAPAINGVSGLDNGKIGNDVGLMVKVGLTKKWSVGTGIIYAKKLYETRFGNYKPNNTMGFKYQPQEVYADCRVLDIPLMVNYQFHNKGKNSFGAGVGISSYIMLKEDYQFIYAKPNKYDIQEYQLRNKNQHWLSMFDLHVTYERQMSSKLSVGLQPYMRIPLQDIGYANVKLQSLGMGVTVNWSLNKLAKKP